MSRGYHRRARELLGRVPEATDLRSGRGELGDKPQLRDLHQRRKGAAQEPYVNHLLEVASLVAGQRMAKIRTW